MEERFAMVLKDDEQVCWCGAANVAAHILRAVRTALIILIMPTIMTMFPVIFLVGNGSVGRALARCWPYYAVAYGAVILAVIIGALLNAENTAFCITDQRAISRGGAFGNHLVHYSLKNVGTVQVRGTIFDSRGAHPSGDLIVSVKDFHNDVDAQPQKLVVRSLSDVYDAYNVLTQLCEGNNETLRVENVSPQ